MGDGEGRAGEWACCVTSLDFFVNGSRNGDLMVTGRFKVVWVGVSGDTSETNVKAMSQSVDYVFYKALFRMKRK